jgi:hypothetical protein
MAKNEAMKIESPTGLRELKPIKPCDVTIQIKLADHKLVSVNLRDDFSFQDLNDHPEIWTLVQQTSPGGATCAPLRPNDKLELRAREWTAYATVNAIEKDKVILFDIRKVSRPKRTVELPHDDDYRIEQVGSRYAVFSNKNNNPNPHGGQTFETVGQAKAFMDSQYGRKVA